MVEKLKVAVAPLDRLQRALLREELVKQAGFTASLADAVIRSAAADATTQQGSPVLFPAREPWAEPVTGAQVLEELVQVIETYVVLPPHAAVALALWILHTHTLDAAQISPRLAIISPEKRCGKTTVLKLLEALVRRSMPATNITAAVLFRTIEAHQPTLLVDEADTFLREREDLRGVLNAGHDRQCAKVPRCVGDDHEPRVFNVWAPVAFAGIGRQHDTLMDRSVVISMKRRSVHGEPVASFRRREREALGDTHRRVVRWARDNVERLRSVQPASPAGLDDRAADNWEALLAIAHIAGEPWLELARLAALALSGAERGHDPDTQGEQLLRDIRQVFEDDGGTAIPAKVLLDRLVAMDERPWPEANHGRPMSPRQLGTRLGRFGVRSRTVRDGNTTARSYVKADFDDAFSRYLATPDVTTGTSAESSKKAPDWEPSPPALVTDAIGEETAFDFVDVTDVTDTTRAMDADGRERTYVALEREAIQEFGS